MPRFEVVSADGTRVIAWRNEGAGTPVLICNGLGTPPITWPGIIADGSGFDVRTWYYRGTAGGERPADLTKVTVADHTDDALAVLDSEQIDSAVLVCWSLGVNVGFELLRRHPDRVAGILAVAGVPGGTFGAMGAPLGIPRPLRHLAGLTGAHTGHAIGRPLGWVSRHIPLSRMTAQVISHSGFVLPRATPDRLLPTLEEFREHDFRWYFTLALAAASHPPMDTSFVDVPVSLVAGRYDVLASLHAMRTAAARIPGAQLTVLAGSHFLPLEFPDELTDGLRALVRRTGLPDDLSPSAAG
ncbi:MAG TPA: alpha/beta hydrolase [Mycobacteriales bacterium]|jgi:pimeloyl-ACP methyl ester carboxylesterase|nr:alpha/beta hydrolase [Mycobacteriales bacterium]